MDEYMAFAVFNGKEITTFVQVNNQFFISIGNEVDISPANRVFGMAQDPKKDYAEFEFEPSSHLPSIMVSCNPKIRSVRRFVSRFIARSSRPLPVSSLFQSPAIARFKLKELFDGMFAGVAFKEEPLPEVKVGLLKSGHKKHRGVRMRFDKYGIDDHGKKLSDVVKEHASSLQLF